MLNVDNFYSKFGQLVGPDEYLCIEDKQILVHSDRVYIVDANVYQEPFMWFGLPFDGVVFRTNTGKLASVVLFDAEYDETDQAVQLCQRLMSVAQ